jgi:outer membrane receptor protein involved in Fe transport
LSFDRQLSRVGWFANYTYLDATFREPLVLQSPNNPVAVDGEIFVSAGDRLPLIPRNLLKAGFHVSVRTRVTIGGEVLAGSDFHMRGDEGNDLARIGDYAVLNLRGDYRVNDNVLLFVNVDNVLDEEYETFGVLGEADRVLGDDFRDNRFFSPAAPRAGWLGVRVEF